MPWSEFTAGQAKTENLVWCGRIQTKAKYGHEKIQKHRYTVVDISLIAVTLGLPKKHPQYVSQDKTQLISFSTWTTK